MDVLTKEQRRRNMQAIRSNGTRMETLLAKSLWKKGYRYRKNDSSILGKPDLTFKRVKLAVFVDSEFFHGKNWGVNKYRIGTNRRFWWQKIEKNIERDKLVNKQLRREGWKILRFWSNDVKKKLGTCVIRVEKTYNERINAYNILRT